MANETIRFTLWDHDDINGMPVHEKTFDVFEGALGLGNGIMLASGEAKAYRDGYFAAMGWDMDEETSVPEGGYRGDVSVGMGERLDWSITLDR